MEKADWECWKKLDERFENNDRSFLFDLDDKDQEDTHRDERIRQRWNVELSQHGQEMDMSPYSPLPPPNSVGPAPRPLLKDNGVQQGGRQGNLQAVTWEVVKS